MASKCLLVLLVLVVAGCTNHTGQSTNPASKILVGSPRIEIFANTTRVGLGEAVFAAGMKFSDKNPSSGIDGQQQNCIAFNPHGTDLQSLQIKASWIPQSSMTQVLRFAVGNGELAKIETERTGNSPFSFVVPLDRIHPSNAGDLAYFVWVTLSNETSEPKAAINQAIELTLEVGVKGGPVTFHLVGCSG